MQFMTRNFIVLSFFSLMLLGLSTVVNAQDRMTVDQRVTFKKGASSAVIKKQIRRGTSHQYRIRAREGQNLTVILTTGKQTSFTISNLSQGTLEGADGETMWRGILSETGEYFILIGTDATANYKLEIYVK
jgi:hypothetical protein